MRRSGDNVRISAHLIDVDSGGNVWADRFDGTLDDAFAFEDEVRDQIVAALRVELTAEEKVSQFRGISFVSTAHDLYLQGQEHYMAWTPASLGRAAELLEQALLADADYARAQALLAKVYLDAWDRGWYEQAFGLSANVVWSRAEHYAMESMREPTSLAHLVRAQMLLYQSRHGESLVEAGRAIALDANSSAGYRAMAYALIYSGNPADALDFIETSDRLDPVEAAYPYARGLAELGLEDYEAALRSFERASRDYDDWTLVLLAASYAHLGETAIAEDTMRRANENRERRGRDPFALEDVSQFPYAREADRERLRAGLVKAGVTEGELSPSLAPKPGFFMPPPGARPLDEAQMLAKIVGNTFVERNREWLEYYVPNAGRLHGEIRGLWNGRDRYSGAWWIRKSVWCVTYRASPDEGGCWSLGLDGDQVSYYDEDGRRWSPPVILVEGNPEKL